MRDLTASQGKVNIHYKAIEQKMRKAVGGSVDKGTQGLQSLTDLGSHP